MLKYSRTRFAHKILVTPPRFRGGVIFSLQFVCVSVCVSDFACEQNSSRTDAPIWTQFSLNGCLPHWLKPYWNWWPWVEGQGHSDVIPIFLHNSLLTSLLCISALLYLIKMKFGMSLRYKFNSGARKSMRYYFMVSNNNHTDNDTLLSTQCAVPVFYSVTKKLSPKSMTKRCKQTLYFFVFF